MIGFFIFIYGICFGSFYGVLITRLPNDQSILGRSYCPNCKATLKPMDLIPILSFILCKGKCKYCDKKISPFNIYIEISTGILFLIAYNIFGISPGFFNAVFFWSMLLIVGIMDLREKIIMDYILIFFTIPSLIIIYFYEGTILNNIYGGLIGLIVYGLFHIITKIIYKKEVFGLGDVFFIVAICLNLGTKNIFLTLFLPFYISFAYTIITIIKEKRINFKKEIPFGPFISISSFLISMGTIFNFKIF